MCTNSIPIRFEAYGCCQMGKHLPIYVEIMKEKSKLKEEKLLYNALMSQEVKPYSRLFYSKIQFYLRVFRILSIYTVHFKIHRIGSIERPILLPYHLPLVNHRIR